MNVIIVGAGISAIGWGILLFFSGMDTGFQQEIVNLHRLAIANNVILLGYVFIIVGGFDLAVNKLRDTSIGQRDAPNPLREAGNVKRLASDDQFLDWDEYSPEELEKISLETSNKEDADSIAAWKGQSGKEN